MILITIIKLKAIINNNNVLYLEIFIIKLKINSCIGP